MNAHAHGRDGHVVSPRVYAAHAQRDSHLADVPAPRLIDLHPDRDGGSEYNILTLILDDPLFLGPSK